MTFIWNLGTPDIIVDIMAMTSQISLAWYFKLISMQPVAKPNRKCCVNGKVESGALKIFFLGSNSVLLHYTLER